MISRFASVAFTITSLFAQTPEKIDRVLHFNHTADPQGMKEIGTVIRAMINTKDGSVDTAEKSLSLSGTEAQIAFAEWLMNVLDRPFQLSQRQNRHEYKMSNTDDFTRVLYVANAETIQQFQEIATAMRSTADIRWLFTYNAQRAMVARGTADQMALAEFLTNRFDVDSAPAPNSAEFEFQMRTGAPENVVHVFYLPNTKSIQSFQEVVTSVRSVTDLRRMFTYNTPRAVAARGTAEQINLASWLFAQLDQPASQPSAKHEYRIPSDSDDIVRLFYLPQIGTVARFQLIAQQIRKETASHHVFTYNEPRVVAVRGTQAQIDLADQVVRREDK
jgi:hypothetical protein